MSEPELEPRSRTAARDVDAVPRAVPAATSAARTPDEAWAAVETILNGRGNAAELVGLVGLLDEAHRTTLQTRLANVALLTTGDATIDVGEIIGAPVSAVLKEALHAFFGPPTTPRLARYVSRVDDLWGLDPAVADLLVARFGGQSLLAVMPRVAGDISGLSRQPVLLRWLIKTTPAAVIADLMGTGGTQDLGTTLDALKLWKPWIDHVRVAHERYQYLASGSKDPDVIAKLIAPYGDRATKDGPEPGHYTIAEATPEAKDELDQATLTGASRDRLLAAINAAGGVRPQSARGVIAALRRIRATADDVLAVSLKLDRPEPEWLRLLLESPGVAAAHALSYVGAHALKISELDDATVRALRAKAGAALRLGLLAPRDDPDGHKAIVGRESLRQWFFEDAQPADLLWLCAQDAALSGQATRAVAARFGDWSWVRKLTAGADHTQLRTLAVTCNDAATAKFLHDDLLHDKKREAQFGGEAMSPRAFGGELDRLRIAIRLGDPDTVLQRVGDLDDAERRAFGRDAAAVTDLGDSVAFNDTQFARVAHLLELTAARCIASCPKGPGAIAYLRTRPPAEERAALADAVLVARAASHLSADLFLVFPSLANRAVLAQALDHNPALLRLLLAGSDAHRVVELIAVEPAATPALEACTAEPAVVRLLPAYDQLSAAGKAFVNRIAKSGDDEDVAAEGERVRTSDAEDRIDEADRERDPDEKRAVERAGAMQELTQVASLPAALDALFAGDHKREMGNLAALLAQRRAEVPALLTEATHWPRVAQIARRIEVPPHVACPFLSIDLLLQMPNALRWYFELADRTVLLHAAGRPGAASLIAQHLAADVPGAQSWLDHLPRGAALTADERRLVDLLEAGTINADVIRKLFLTRFDVEPPPIYQPGEEAKPAASRPRGAGYGAGELDGLYRIASRLPVSHLDQKRIRRIASDVTENAIGSWDGAVIRVDPDLHEGLAKDTFHPDTQVDAPDQGWLTTDEVKRDFGYDDAKIAAQVAARNLATRVVDGMTLYKMKPAKVDLFTQVVLHEIGHSVDSMLGGKTSAVFEFAGWHEYNDAGFDTWAAEMGGWDQVTAADKVKIREAWIDATREGKGVHQLVSRDHPALHERYAGVPIVASARDGKAFHRDERVAHNGRVFVAGSYPGTWYSLKADVVPSAPSYFSLHAPQEYFAESYVEYYRQVDGSPGSEKNKGGGLAAPVKQFFDQHVDTLKYDPQRFQSGD